MKSLKFFDRIHWKFITIYMLLILIAMQVIGAYFNQALETHYSNNFTRMLDQQAGLFAYSVQEYMKEPLEREEVEPYRDIDVLIETMFNTPHAEIQVLDQNGIVISTSSDKQGLIGQRNTQLEVTRALQGTGDEVIRINPQNGHRMKILSQPIKDGDEVIGAIYLMASMEEMYQTVRDINNILATGTGIALFLTFIIGIALARTITSPIKEMTQQATSMAEGDFSSQVTIYGKDEIGQLATAFNYLSDRLSNALSENEEEKNKLGSILFNMSDGVMATDRFGKIILMNQKAKVMLTHKEADVLGLHIKEVLDIPEEIDTDRLLLNNQSFLIDGREEGQSIILQVNMTPLQTGGEQIQGVIAVLQDVTEQEKLERERKEFVANVSHELRTPLTTMKSYLEALEEGALADADIAPRFIKVTQNETERMIRLVNDLLQLSKIDTKKYRLILQKTNMAALIKDVTDRFSVQFNQRELSLQLHVAQEIPFVYVDRDQMIQVLDNIISNAIKYSTDKGSIHIDVDHVEQDLLISITDNGVGISKSELKHVFKRFYRVDKARSRDMGGTGLGLAIAREMIIAHKGTIAIDSDVGQGTTVRIRIPIEANMKEE